MRSLFFVMLKLLWLSSPTKESSLNMPLILGNYYIIILYYYLFIFRSSHCTYFYQIFFTIYFLCIYYINLSFTHKIYLFLVCKVNQLIYMWILLISFSHWVKDFFVKPMFIYFSLSKPYFFFPSFYYLRRVSIFWVQI